MEPLYSQETIRAAAAHIEAQEHFEGYYKLSILNNYMDYLDEYALNKVAKRMAPNTQAAAMLVNRVTRRG